MSTEESQTTPGDAPVPSSPPTSGYTPVPSDIPTPSAPPTSVAASASGGSAGAASPVSEATLRQLERICERLGADPLRSPQMARQLVKRAGQLSRERDWSEARALEHLLSLMFNASGGGSGPQSPL